MAYRNPYGGGATGYYQPPLLSPLQQQAYLNELRKRRLGAQPQDDGGLFGFLPDVIEEPLGDALDVVGKAAEQIGTALIYSPVGLYHMGKATVQDIADLPEGEFFERSRNMYETMGRQFVEDFRHPLRNPGYLLMDIASLASLGTGGALRVSAAAGKLARGLEHRAVEAGRRPPPPPPSAHIPSGPDEPPLVPTGPEQRPLGLQEGHEFVPPSSIPTKRYHAPPMKRGVVYRIKTEKGDVYDWEYVRTDTKVGRETYHFIDPETGRRRQTTARGLRNVEFDKLTRAEQPKKPVRKDLQGNLRDSMERFSKVEEPILKEDVKVLRQAEDAGLIPKGETTRQIADKQVAQKGVGEPVKATPVGLDWQPSTLVGERGFMRANHPNQPGRAYVIKPEGTTPEGVSQWGLYHVIEGKESLRSAKFTGTPGEALTQAKAAGDRHARMIGLEISGGAPAPTLGQLGREVAGALFGRRPPAPTRTIEQFRYQEPIYPESRHSTTVFTVTNKNPEGVWKETKAPVGETVTDVAGRPFPMTRKTDTMSRYGERLAQELDTQTALFAEEKRIPLNQVQRRDPKTGEMVLDTGELVPAKVILSRNPIVRMIQNLQLDHMERFPESRNFLPGPYVGRNLNQIHDFNTKEAARVMRDAPEDVVEEAKTVGAAVRRFEKMGGGDKVAAVIDSMNMMAKLFVLYTKPAYWSANAIGQTALTLADHAWNPVNLAKSVRLQWAVHRDRRRGESLEEQIELGMQEGVSLHFQGEQGVGILPAVRERIGPVIPFPGGRRNIPGYEQWASAANWALDKPFRNAAFYNEARRRGFDSPDKIEKLLNDEGLAGVKEEVFREANRNIIDYGRLGPNEKRFIRRVVFFYPWFKGATVYTGRFISQHPAQALIAGQLGQEAVERTERELGPLPSYLKGAGVFKVGERNVPGLGPVPTIVNPQSAGVLGTAGEAMAGLRALAFGGGGEAHQLSQYLTPAVSAALTAVTRKDPFTGADIPANQGAPEVIGRQLLDVPAILRLRGQLDRAQRIESGQLDPKDILHPYSYGEAANRFLLGIAPYALNPTVARSRAFAEERSLASLRQREILNARDYRRRYLLAGQETGLFNEMPTDLSQALAQRGLREAELAQFGETLGREMTPLDRLTSDVNLAVRQGRLAPEQARSMLMQMVQANENQIQQLRDQMAQAYWGSGTISNYRSALTAYGTQQRL